MTDRLIVGVDYSQPPVLVGTPVPTNGKWVDGRAVFTNYRIGSIDGSVRMWAWLENGDALPVDIRMNTRSLMSRDTITVSDIEWAP